MPPVPLNEGMSAAEFRSAAARSKDANQAQRLLALAAVRDGLDRGEAARIGGMDRQTLRDWVHAFNARGIDGLVNATAPGRLPKLSPGQKAGINALALKVPDPASPSISATRVPFVFGAVCPARDTGAALVLP